jgi:hypothetical protein
MIKRINTDTIWLTGKACVKRKTRGMGIPDLRELNMCLLDSWFRDTMTLNPSFGDRLLIASIKWSLISFAM